MPESAERQAPGKAESRVSVRPTADVVAALQHKGAVPEGQPAAPRVRAAAQAPRPAKQVQAHHARNAPVDSAWRMGLAWTACPVTTIVPPRSTARTPIHAQPVARPTARTVRAACASRGTIV